MIRQFTVTLLTASIGLLATNSTTAFPIEQPISEQQNDPSAPVIGNPVPAGLVFPEFQKRPEKSARLIRKEDGSGYYIGANDDLPMREATPELENKIERQKHGETLLQKMAQFISRQDSIAFELKLHTDEEGTMGFVSSDLAYDVAFAKPNRFRIRMLNPPEKTFTPEYASNGRHMMRIQFGKCMIENCPDSLQEIVNREMLQPLNRWSPDIHLVLSLFDPASLQDLITASDVYYIGTRPFGDVMTNHILLDGGGDDGAGFYWELFITQGNRPVPVMIELGNDGIFPSLIGRKRFSDSSLRFTDWNLNAPETLTEFQLSLADGIEVVDSRDRLWSGEMTSLNPMVGKPLPPFTMSDDNGQTIASKSLISKTPTVLVLMDKTGNQTGAWWKTLSEIEQQFQSQGVRFIPIHPGTESREDILTELERFNVVPEIMMESGELNVFSPGALRHGWSGKLTNVAVGDYLQLYVIGSDGKIHQVVNTGSGMAAELSKQLTGLLAGKDMAQENARELEQTIESRKVRVQEFLQSLKSQD